MAKEIEITFDNSDHFYVGSLVKGTVLVTVTRPQNYNTISIDLIGKAEVNWSDNEATGLGRTKRVTYRNAVTYINAQKIVWTKDYSPTDDLPVGSHAFPFEFQLPKNIPPSFEGEHGWMRYEFGATAARNGLLEHDHVDRARLDVRDRMDILRVYKEPRLLDTDKKLNFFWRNAGTISGICSVKRTGFFPGDNIPIDMHIINQTSRTIHLSASLYRKETYITPSKQKTEEVRVAKIVSPQIGAGKLLSFNTTDLVIPEDIPATIRNCSCIQVEYDLVIKTVVPWSFNSTQRIPLLITNREPAAQEEQVIPEAQISLASQAVGLLRSMFQPKRQVAEPQHVHQLLTA